MMSVVRIHFFFFHCVAQPDSSASFAFQFRKFFTQRSVCTLSFVRERKKKRYILIYIDAINIYFVIYRTGFIFLFFYNYRLFRLGGRSYVSMSGAQLCVRWNSITRGELFRKHVSADTIPECYRYSTEASCSRN